MRSWNEGKTYFIHQDGLGTERMRTDGSGTVAATFFSLPFGDDQQVTTPIPNSYPAPQEQKFAMNDYDGDSNTFHAQFRNYNLSMGRWLSPDPYDGSYDLTNPQSFNRYAYVLNNPLSFKDPSGLDCQATEGGWECDPGDPSDPSQPSDPTDPTDPGQNQGNPNDQQPVNQGQPYMLPPAYGWLFLPTPVLESFSGPGWLLPGIIASTPVYSGPTGSGGGGTAPSKGSFLDRWPFNGNLVPLPPAGQDGVCTTGPAAKAMNSDPAILSCCKAHDNCYDAHQCNATSWVPAPLNPISGSCTMCNLKAAACISGALF